MSRRSAAETRGLILNEAHKLFYWQGIRGTGVDAVAAAAGVAPVSLYRSFPSKDALVAAYVVESDYRSRANFEAAVAADANPRDRILAVFRHLANMTHPDVCRGCSAHLTLAEYPDPLAEPHQRAKEAKAWIIDRYVKLASAFCESYAPETDPDLLAGQLFLIHEGLIASALSGFSDRLAEKAVALVHSILERSKSREIEKVESAPSATTSVLNDGANA